MKGMANCPTLLYGKIRPRKKSNLEVRNTLSIDSLAKDRALSAFCVSLAYNPMPLEQSRLVQWHQSEHLLAKESILENKGVPSIGLHLLVTRLSGPEYVRRWATGAACSK